MDKETFDKQIFKEEVKKTVEKYACEFPIYFLVNIIINLILLGFILLGLFLLVMSAQVKFSYGGEAAVILMVLSASILRVTGKGFLRNWEILKRIRRGDYEFGLDDHEIDNAIEFLEDLPMPKEEVARMKIALSYGKLIEVFEAVRLLTYDKINCNLSLKFKYQVEKAVEKSHNLI